VPNDPRKDRRVQKTQGLLHEALASLIHEKAYDAILVKEILIRANVGRSTFYTHFRDKDALLDRGIRDVLRPRETTSSTRSAGLAERILQFSLPLFEHVERYRGASDSPVDAQGLAVVHEHLQRVLVELIAEELGRVGQRHQEGRQNVPSDLLARHVAATFLLVLTWWAEREERLPASEVNDVFRALILPAVTEVLGP
jgi:AcrR family transcriptional regulator